MAEDDTSGEQPDTTDDEQSGELEIDVTTRGEAAAEVEAHEAAELGHYPRCVVCDNAVRTDQQPYRQHIDTEEVAHLDCFAEALVEEHEDYEEKGGLSDLRAGFKDRAAKTVRVLLEGGVRPAFAIQKIESFRTEAGLLWQDDDEARRDALDYLDALERAVDEGDWYEEPVDVDPLEDVEEL